ncbi:MAG: hypothetical protein LAT52_04475 [Balneolales bacterium]|nr:hypothetical protein [Balneolales bacterium]
MQTRFDYIFHENLDFHAALQDVLEYQLGMNRVYRTFYDGVQSMNLGGRPPQNQDEALPLGGGEVLPLMPVEAFRDARVYAAGNHPPELFFQSSGTTTSVRSRHEVAFAEVYRTSIFAGMQAFYALENMVVLGYTPGYNENPNSSLVWMINALIDSDPTGLSRFLPIGQSISRDLLNEIERNERSVLLFGAAFGLVDLAEQHPTTLPEGSIIMETGGMKTYRREMSRQQLHEMLADGFALPWESIHSEYGMTELLSQSYALGDEWFRCPAWVRISIRNPLNPVQELPAGQEGLIGVIDLANWASCPFVLTGDRGVQRADGAFQVLGRWSQYHLRGCNFLLEDGP